MVIRPQNIYYQLSYKIAIGLVSIIILSSSTKSEEKGIQKLNDSNSVSSFIMGNNQDTNSILKDLVYPVSSEDIKGMILPNIDDTSLLTLIYGSYKEENGKKFYNWGPKIWDTNDSVYMKVCNRIGDDSFKVIYIRGEMAITAVMHDFYNETALLLYKTKKGWIVMDSYIDKEVNDFANVQLEGKYNDLFLLKYETFGVFAGGVQFGDVIYTLISSKSLKGPFIRFISSSSNTGSNECEKTENRQICDCYSLGGEVVFQYDNSLKCLVFKYNFAKSRYECGITNEHVQNANQTWYMNTDTSFLGDGNPISLFGDSIKGKIMLTDIEIIKRLNEKRK
jgi:hypothetical protein